MVGCINSYPLVQRIKGVNGLVGAFPLVQRIRGVNGLVGAFFKVFDILEILCTIPK